TLFGPETPRLFAARTIRNHVFWAGIACSPCVSALNGRTSACRDNVCMQRIDVDGVFDEVCRIYETRTAGGASQQSLNCAWAALLSWVFSFFLFAFCDGYKCRRSYHYRHYRGYLRGVAAVAPLRQFVKPAP